MERTLPSYWADLSRRCSECDGDDLQLVIDLLRAAGTCIMTRNRALQVRAGQGANWNPIPRIDGNLHAATTYAAGLANMRSWATTEVDGGFICAAVHQHSRVEAFGRTPPMAVLAAATKIVAEMGIN